MTYYIYRFYFNGRRRFIKTVETLEDAQKHCNDPETRDAGEWFDGYSQKNLN